MPIIFLDGFTRAQLRNTITHNGEPLYGEIWFYEQLLEIDRLGLVKDTWYVKWNYTLSSHPDSRNKSEGQIDFLIISKYGVLIIEIKGGNINLKDGNFSYEYQGLNTPCQDPFIQVKENMFSLNTLLNDKDVFFYRAVIFPHDTKFKPVGPSYEGYAHQFFSRLDIINIREREQTESLHRFLIKLARTSRSKLVAAYTSQKATQQLNSLAFERYPELNNKKVEQVKRALFPNSTSYGFNPESLNKIIQDENVEIFDGLRKNKKIMIQGPPGSGKTVLARKFIADQILKDQKGIYLCATKLLSAYMTHDLLIDNKINPNSLVIKTFPYDAIDNYVNKILGSTTVDFVVVDEAQEFMDRGLDDLIFKMCEKLGNPRFLLLYDNQQAFMASFTDFDFFPNYVCDNYGFVHYEFSTVHRSSQSKKVTSFCKELRECESHNILQTLNKALIPTSKIRSNQLGKLVRETYEKAKSLTDSSLTFSDTIILVESRAFDAFKIIVNKYYSSNAEELTEDNIGIIPTKIRFTTPLKFKGLEKPNVILILKDNISAYNKVQAYVGATRAMVGLYLYLWETEVA
ncbi:GTPase SAR1 family protein [Pontibacter aydingkolensis]|uniref:NERD domain-containing protein n=1 Tax=Pontibacter aydingkolensis TaxID=1911536 RepID=A0ABS7CQ93_9BACT|nr:NERD domain-containing protein [Pontibacter aydingkolensis]MBW7465994.1 NERD domain-containing protein [Pontibacter aydingkolensis]